MKTYKITKNGQTVKAGLTRDEALDQLFPIIEDFSSGYIYDNEAETIFNEVDKRVVAVKGDESVKAGNDLFEIEVEEEDLFIIDKDGVEQPAWRHEDGTLVSFWTGFDKLLIKGDDGVQEIEHSTAIELGYINN